MRTGMVAFSNCFERSRNPFLQVMPVSLLLGLAANHVV